MRINAFHILLVLRMPTMALKDHQADEWRFTLLFPMLWALDIQGDIQVGNDRYTVNLSSDDKIKDPDTGLIGEFFAQKDNWIGGVKLNYTRSERLSGREIDHFLKWLELLLAHL